MKLKKGQKIFIFSGAGISAPSGVPTFRTNNGLWENHDIDEVCNFKTWKENYSKVHEFYNQRRIDLENVKPNEAHNIIANMQKELGEDRVINITTNVDDLFERAGVKNTIYLHGNIRKVRNMNTNEEQDLGYKPFNHKDTAVGEYKPSVIFFHEIPPEYANVTRIVCSRDKEDNDIFMLDGDIVLYIGMSYQVVPVDMFYPFHKDINVFNINVDDDTEMHWDFNKNYIECATTALPKFIKDYL
jgi:NAD-dependent deacetylase